MASRSSDADDNDPCSSTQPCTTDPRNTAIINVQQPHSTAPILTPPWPVTSSCSFWTPLILAYTDRLQSQLTTSFLLSSIRYIALPLLFLWLRTTYTLLILGFRSWALWRFGIRIRCCMRIGVWDIRYRVIHYIDTGVLDMYTPRHCYVDVGAWVWGWSDRRCEIMLINNYVVCIRWRTSPFGIKGFLCSQCCKLAFNSYSYLEPRQTRVIGETAKYLKRGLRTTSAIDPWIRYT
jgi:hypothetical protein